MVALHKNPAPLARYTLHIQDNGPLTLTLHESGKRDGRVNGRDRLEMGGMGHDSFNAAAIQDRMMDDASNPFEAVFTYGFKPAGHKTPTVIHLPNYTEIALSEWHQAYVAFFGEREVSAESVTLFSKIYTESRSIGVDFSEALRILALPGVFKVVNHQEKQAPSPDKARLLALRAICGILSLESVRPGRQAMASAHFIDFMQRYAPKQVAQEAVLKLHTLVEALKKGQIALSWFVSAEDEGTTQEIQIKAFYKRSTHTIHLPIDLGGIQDSKDWIACMVHEFTHWERHNVSMVNRNDTTFDTEYAASLQEGYFRVYAKLCAIDKPEAVGLAHMNKMRSYRPPSIADENFSKMINTSEQGKALALAQITRAQSKSPNEPSFDEFETERLFSTLLNIRLAESRWLDPTLLQMLNGVIHTLYSRHYNRHTSGKTLSSDKKRLQTMIKEERQNSRYYLEKAHETWQRMMEHPSASHIRSESQDYILLQVIAISFSRIAEIHEKSEATLTPEAIQTMQLFTAAELKLLIETLALAGIKSR